MFTLASPPTHSAFHSPSSPLAPRSSNITPARPPYPAFFSKMPPLPGQQPQTPSYQPQSTFSSPITPSTFTPTALLPDFEQTPQHSARRRADPRRVVKQSAEQKRDQRRDSFLKKVQEQRDDRRWDARGDQILHDDYFSQRKAWQESLNSDAPVYEPESIAEFAVPMPAEQGQWQAEQQASRGGEALSTIVEQSGHQPEDEIEELLDAEARELEALIAMHEAPQSGTMQEEVAQTRRPMLEHQQSSPFLGPDDADFDDLLMGEASADDVMDMS